MQKFILAIILTIGNCLIFWNIQDFSFVWSDYDNLVANSSINPPSKSGIRNIWQGKTDGYYDPVTKTAQSGIARFSYYRNIQQSSVSQDAEGGATDTKQHQEKSDSALAVSAVSSVSAVSASPVASPKRTLSPAAFHTASLIIHCLNTILVFLILCFPCKGRFASFFGAALFAYHPLQVEPIAWNSAFGVLLGGFFALIALWQFMHFTQARESQSRKSKNPMHHFYTATAAFVLSMLAMPSMVIVPLMAFFLDRLPAKDRGFLPPRKPVWPFAVWLVMTIPFVFLAISSQATHAITTDTSIWSRPLIAGDAIMFYLQKIFIPIGIGPDYGRSPAKVLSDWWGYTSWILPFIIPIYLLYTRSKSRVWLGCAYSLLVIGLLPYLGLIAFESQGTSTVANRYMYLSMLGPAIGIAYLISIPRNFTIPLISIAAIFAFSFVSISEVQVWENDERLWKHALNINEESPIAHKILADKFRQKKEWAQAKSHYNKVLKSNSTSAEVHFHLANIEKNLGRPDLAIPLFEKALKLDPGFAAAHNALGLSLLSENKNDDALLHFSKAVKTEPTNARSLQNLGKTLVKLGRDQEAIEVLRKSLKTKSKSANSLSISEKSETQALLGQALSQNGQEKMGQIHLEIALNLDSNHAVANRILGNIYFAQNNYDAALKHYKKATKVFLNDRKMLYSLGIIMSKRLDYKQAQSYFKKALDLAPSSAETLTHLGISEFNLKNFTAATLHFEKALKINPKQADPNYYLGDIARWKGKQDRALALYYRTLRISKYHAKAHYRLGNHFMGENSPRQALRHYRSALKRSPGNKHVIANLKRAERKISESL